MDRVNLRAWSRMTEVGLGSLRADLRAGQGLVQWMNRVDPRW